MAWRSENTWLLIADGQTTDSKMFLYSLQRIIEISDKNYPQNIIDDLNDDKNKHLHNLYIQILGLIGNKKATVAVLNKYIDHQNDNNSRSTAIYSIDSLGMIGDEQAAPILERLFINYDAHTPLVDKYSIARALYLITGKLYSYKDDSGEDSPIPLTKELKKARGIIENSGDRPRTVEEIKFFAKLYRP